jgi:membrane-associated HD superfamily phosphohydrolase
VVQLRFSAFSGCSLLITNIVYLFFVFFSVEYPNLASSGLSKAALGGILASTIASAIALSAVVTALIMRRNSRTNRISRRSCKSL